MFTFLINYNIPKNNNFTGMIFGQVSTKRFLWGEELI